jgi:hypothetical protein
MLVSVPRSLLISAFTGGTYTRCHVGISQPLYLYLVQRANGCAVAFALRFARLPTCVMPKNRPPPGCANRTPGWEQRRVFQLVHGFAWTYRIACHRRLNSGYCALYFAGLGLGFFRRFRTRILHGVEWKKPRRARLFERLCGRLGGWGERLGPVV